MKFVKHVVAAFLRRKSWRVLLTFMLLCSEPSFSQTQNDEGEVNVLAQSITSSTTHTESSFNTLSSEWHDFFAPEYIKNSYPWIQTYLDAAKIKVPSNAVAKWKSPIVIGVGLPNDLQAYDLEEGQARYRKFELYLTSYPIKLSYGLEAVTYDQLDYLIGALSPVTGLEIKKRKTKKDFSNVRIVFIRSHDHWESAFKKGRVQDGLSVLGGPRPILFREDIEGLTPRYEFTPNTLDNVDGVFLVNKNNEIILSTCYIWAGHPAYLIRGMVTECVIRSLGIPNLLKNNLDPVLNGTYTRMDGSNQDFKISDEQKLLLSTLYRPDVTPGMRKDDLIKILNTKK